MAENLTFVTYNGPLEVDKKNRTFKCYMSSASQDRDKEYIEPEAFLNHLRHYLANPVLLLGHNHKTTPDTLPIGKCLAIEVDGDKLKAEFWIAPTKVGNDCLTLLDTGCLRAVSAGFIPVNVIRNPQDHELPSYLRGKGLKSYYKEVELVEVSLLSIPSNREALVMHAEKGNRVADMVLKEFNGEDITPILKEWLAEEKEQRAIDPDIQSWKGFVNKLFGLWHEEDHPRDDDGRFSSGGKPDYTPGFQSTVNSPMSWRPFGSDPKHEEINKKLDTILAVQGRMGRDIQELKDKDSWGQWAKTWAVRVAAVAGLYYGLKHMAKSPEVQRKIKDWVIGTMSKGAIDLDAVDKLLAILDRTKTALDKGKALGAVNTPEYRTLRKFYDRMVAEMRGIAQGDVMTVKEMTPENFKEEEHPRASDGQFKKKDSTETETRQSAVKKVALAGVGAFTSVAIIYAGMKIARGSNIFSASKEEIKSVIKDITKAGGGKKSEALEGILNIKIDKDIDSSQLSGFTKDVYSYVTNPLQMQKDLAETFGHLNIKGATEFTITKEVNMFNIKDFNELTKNMTCYHPSTGVININLEQLEELSSMLKISPRRLIEHEYAHSLTMRNVPEADRLMEKYTKLWMAEIKTLEGQEVTPGLVIKKVEITTRTREELAEEALALFKSMDMKDTALDISNWRKVTHKADLVMDYQGQIINTSSDHFLMAAPHMKIPGKDTRDIYGLANPGEYISVKVEKGEKLWI